MSGHDAALPVFHASDGGRRPRSRGFFGAVYPQLQPLHDEGMAEDGRCLGSSPCRTGWAQRADTCGRAVFCSGFAVINSRFPAVPLRSCSRNDQLAYAIDIRLLLCSLDTANGNGGVRRHGCGVESPAGRLRRTKPVAWVVAEARGVTNEPQSVGDAGDRGFAGRTSRCPRAGPMSPGS